MASWREQILKEFTPDVARLTLVADPDRLLLEEGILEGISARGFELIPFEDHVAFRYAYESRYRARWDGGEQTDLVVVLHAQADDLAALPYDLLQAGRMLAFNLGELFPNLSYPVVAALDLGDLETLYIAQMRYEPGVLGDNATKDFVLRHVFETTPELIKQPADLLRVLLRRHYRGQRVPAMLDDRLIQLLRQRSAFAEWPLEIIVPDRDSFFAFLQERWPIFLDRMIAKGELAIHEGNASYGLTIDGPIDLPFDHHDIRVYVDSLFLDGLLHPVEHEQADAVFETWVGFGVKADSIKARSRRLHKTIEGLQSSVPSVDAKHGDWLQFARRWAELIVLSHEQTDASTPEISEQLDELRSLVDTRFENWLAKRYAGLINLPPNPPVMVHHLPRYLNRQIEDDDRTKIALLVVDGLSLDQWLVLRKALAEQRPNLGFRERSVIAWIPSLTSVSRQAIFAGKPPMYFPDSIHTTDRESKLWMQFWVDQGLASHEVVYAKGLGDGSLEEVSELLDHPKVRVAGLVIDKVDKIMHGMQLGIAGMHNQVRQWADQPYLGLLLDVLMVRGFRIYLTSDHGNIEAEGCGSPAEGVLADQRGQRVRIYSEETLRSSTKKQFSSAVEWDPVGLPESYLALLAPSRQAFTQKQKRTVSHGGASLEELIVPLVQIDRRSR